MLTGYLSCRHTEKQWNGIRLEINPENAHLLIGRQLVGCTGLRLESAHEKSLLIAIFADRHATDVLKSQFRIYRCHRRLAVSGRICEVSFKIPEKLNEVSNARFRANFFVLHNTLKIRNQKIPQLLQSKNQPQSDPLQKNHVIFNNNISIFL